LRTGEEFLAFVGKATAPHRGREIHVVLDNLSAPTTPEVAAWFEGNPHVTSHVTPVGASWLNQVEIWFGLITKQSIRRGTFSSVSALVGEIRAYIDQWNTAPRPFTWTATADGTLAKVRLVQTNIKKTRR
jgi:DDE superfamily endonuclease